MDELLQLLFLALLAFLLGFKLAAYMCRRISHKQGN